MAQPSVIAIDGPAGAGKSTLGARLAAHLGYLYFDTGVMYRALAYRALRDAVPVDDEAALEALALRTTIDVLPPSVADGRQYTVIVDDEDVTWALRQTEVEASVSRVARFPAVRREMVRRQQAIGRRGQVVMVGRDIGTVVMPDAELKIYLEASLDERCRRRLDELRARGQAVQPAQVYADLARRDEQDRHVMERAADAVALRNDELSLDDEVMWLMEYIRQRATAPYGKE